MADRTSVLSLLVALLPAAIGLGGEGATVPPIKAVQGVRPQADAFKAAGWGNPLVIRSEKEAAEHFAGDALAAIRRQVDFKQQTLLVFAWRGSGQDRLTYSVAESYPEQISFALRPGRTRDLRTHVQAYTLRSNVTWTVPGDARGSAGGEKPARPTYSPEQLAAAKKDPRYRQIYEAKDVVVATLDEAKAGAATMSYPPTYGFDLTLTIVEALRGSLKPQQSIHCSYSKTAVEAPALPVGKRCLVLLRLDGPKGMAYLLEEESADLLKVARIAAAEADKADEASAALARENPAEHPLYPKLKEADGVLVATADPDGVASHDSQGTTTLSEVCVLGMRGGLKAGSRFQAVFPPAVAPNGKLPDAKFLILAFRQAGGKYLISCVAEASDTNLRVAAAATGTPLRTRQDLEKAPPPTRKPDDSPGGSGSSPPYDPGSQPGNAGR